MNAQRADRLSLPADPVCEQATLSIWERVRACCIGLTRFSFSHVVYVLHASFLHGSLGRRVGRADRMILSFDNQRAISEKANASKIRIDARKR